MEKSISAKALVSLVVSIYNKVQLLFLVEDVVKINNYLHQRQRKYEIPGHLSAI